MIEKDVLFNIKIWLHSVAIHKDIIIDQASAWYQ